MAFGQLSGVEFRTKYHLDRAQFQMGETRVLVEQMINLTPTSPLRDELTNINIRLARAETALFESTARDVK